MTRVLVTGGTGFIGGHVVRYLADQGLEVLATDLRGRPELRERRGSVVQYDQLDVTDRSAVDRLIAGFRPDVIYHFAGQAYVIPSWENPHKTFEVNLTGTLNLLEAVRRQVPRCVFAFAGSGTEYGSPDAVPTSEDAALRPTSPYAASKAAADLLCYQYAQSFDLRVFRYRIFGTTGPGKRGDACNDFAGQIARLESDGGEGAVRIGDLDKQRDITDVRDAVRAMVLVAERGESGGAYNIGSGEPRRVRDILDTLLELAKRKLATLEDPERLRLVDEPVHLADVRRLKSLGWAPRIPFRQTLQDILEFWRTNGDSGLPRG